MLKTYSPEWRVEKPMLWNLHQIISGQACHTPEGVDFVRAILKLVDEEEILQALGLFLEQIQQVPEKDRESLRWLEGKILEVLPVDLRRN